MLLHNKGQANSSSPAGKVMKFKQRPVCLRICETAAGNFFWLPDKQIRLLVYSVSQLTPLVSYQKGFFYLRRETTESE